MQDFQWTYTQKFISKSFNRGKYFPKCSRTLRGHCFQKFGAEFWGPRRTAKYYPQKWHEYLWNIHKMPKIFSNLVLNFKNDHKKLLKVQKCPNWKEKLGQSFIMFYGIVLRFLEIYLPLTSRSRTSSYSKILSFDPKTCFSVGCWA